MVAVYAPVAASAITSPGRSSGSMAASIRTSPDSQCFPAIV